MAVGVKSMAGGLFGGMALTDANRLNAGQNDGISPGILGGKLNGWDTAQLISSGLTDAYSAYRGQQGSSLDDSLKGIRDRNLQHSTLQAAATARQALLDANGDPAATKAALLNYAMLGGDSGALLNIMRSDRPELKSFGVDQNVFSINPLTNEQKQIQTGQRKPIIAGGMSSADNGKTFQAIPGYTAQQSAIYNARAAATEAHRAPKATKAAGAITLPHPGSLY